MVLNLSQAVCPLYQPSSSSSCLKGLVKPASVMDCLTIAEAGAKLEALVTIIIA
jgi:hypothetical protein